MQFLDILSCDVIHSRMTFTKQRIHLKNWKIYATFARLCTYNITIRV